MFEVLDDGFKRLVIFGWKFLYAENDVAIHLNEATIAVPCETLVLGGFGKCLDGFVIKTEVEDGVHHTRHRVTGTGANCEKKWKSFIVAKFVAHDFFHVGDACFHLRTQNFRISFLVIVVVSADFGGDGETCRNRKTDDGHFGKVCTFTSEEFFHFAVSIGFTCAPSINILGFFNGGFLCSGFLRGWFLSYGLLLSWHRVIIVGLDGAP